MVSGSKSTYCKVFPNHLTVFNSNFIQAETKKKFWYGDINVTKDYAKLMLAAKIMGPFYILYEMDARFENEQEPKLDRYVVYVTPYGIKPRENYYVQLSLNEWFYEDAVQNKKTKKTAKEIQVGAKKLYLKQQRIKQAEDLRRARETSRWHREWERNRKAREAKEKALQKLRESKKARSSVSRG